MKAERVLAAVLETTATLVETLVPASTGPQVVGGTDRGALGPMIAAGLRGLASALKPDAREELLAMLASIRDNGAKLIGATELDGQVDAAIETSARRV